MTDVQAIMARAEQARRRRAEAQLSCAECGTADGPDRQTRWELGQHDLERWERCEQCGAALCDSCALTPGGHACEARLAAEALDAPGLAAEVRRLQARVAELEGRPGQA